MSCITTSSYAVVVRIQRTVQHTLGAIKHGDAVHGVHIKADTHYPYIRPVCTGVKNAPVYTGRTYGPYKRALGTHHPYIRAVQPKSIANNAFLYGPYIRAVYTGDRYAVPVHTARTYCPYVRAVCTGVKNAPVYTGRKYGPYIRVTGTHYL